MYYQNKVSKNKFIPIVNAVGSLFEKYLKEEQRKKYTSLLQTCISDKNLNIGLTTLTGFKFLSTMSLIILGMFLIKNMYISIIFSFCLGLAGFFVPDFILARLACRRAEEFENDLPYIIDLLSIATLSGQNIYNSLKILVDKYNGSVSYELGRFLNEISFGIGRQEAYRNIVSRNNAESFESLIFLLIQAEKYGSSINEILKQKSRYLRFEINQRCEIRSRRISILLLFPLVFLILPAFILLVGGPLVFSIAGSLLSY